MFIFKLFEIGLDHAIISNEPSIFPFEFSLQCYYAKNETIVTGNNQ